VDESRRIFTISRNVSKCSSKSSSTRQNLRGCNKKYWHFETSYLSFPSHKSGRSIPEKAPNYLEISQVTLRFLVSSRSLALPIFVLSETASLPTTLLAQIPSIEIGSISYKPHQKTIWKLSDFCIQLVYQPSSDVPVDIHEHPNHSQIKRSKFSGVTDNFSSGGN